MSSVELGRRLREAREGAGLSFRQLRESSGCTVSHLQRLESGEVRAPQPATLRRLSSALGVPYEELLRLAGHL